MRFTWTLLIGALWAQVDSVSERWSYEGLIGVQAAQTALTNWQAGGQNQTALGMQGRMKGRWHTGRTTLSLETSGQWGVLRVVPQRTWRKTQDFLLSVFQYEREIGERRRWAFSGIADGRTQWAPTYEYIGDSAVRPAKAAFLAPLYGQFSLGLRYRPAKGWTLTWSPLSGRVTYVRLGYLADAGAFGLKPALRDEQGNLLQPARRTLWEVGHRLTSRLSLTPLPSLTLSHFFDVFVSYSQAPQGPILVSQFQGAYKLKSWLALTLTQQAIYDPRIGKGKEALQLLTAWSVGFTWSATSPSPAR